MKRNLLRTVGALLLAAVLMFVGANVVDYLRFTRAMARATGLTQDQLRAMGDWCQKAPRDEQRILEGKDIPTEFLPLNPEEIERFWPVTRFWLYQLGDIRVSFVIVTLSENQEIGISIVDSDTPKWTSLWYRDPALAKKVNPDHRLVTIRHNDKEWIVEADKITVVGERPENHRTQQVFLASTSITPTDRSLLEEIIRAIPKEARDDIYNCAGNGISSADSVLEVNFTSDGHKSSEEIMAINAWIDVLGPLTNEVSKLAPKGYTIEHRKMTAGFTADPKRYPVNVTTDRRTLQSSGCDPTPAPPWWCVWRSLSGRKDAGV